MPIANSPTPLRSTLDQILSDKSLTQEEAKSLLTQLKTDGSSSVEINEVVEALTTALGGSGDGLDVSTPESREVVNQLMGALSREGALTGLSLPENSEKSYVDLLTERSELGEPALKTKGLSGQPAVLNEAGQLTVAGRRPVLDLTAPNDTLLNGLWALARPGRAEAAGTDEAKSEAQRAFSKTLVDQLKVAVATSDDEPGKFRRHQAITAALGALVECKASWDPSVADALLELTPGLGTRMQKALVKRALEGEALLSEAQAEKFSAVEFPDNAEELLTQYDAFQNETAKAGFTTIKGPAAQFGLATLCFAKNQAAIDNVLGGMKEWDQLNPSWNSHWDSEELSIMRDEIETYVEKYPQVVYTFGTYNNNAPKQVASILSEKAVALVTGDLDAETPNLKGFELNSEQASYIKAILPNCRDEAAIDQLVRSLETARGVLPVATDGTMAPAAFELFRKSAVGYQEQAEATRDGKLTYRDFQSDLRSSVAELKSSLQPVMQGLSGREPTLGEVALSTEAAAFLRNALTQNLRSEMSLQNLTRAVEIFGKAHDGKLEGEAFAQFQTMVTDYKANWPDRSFFDFNKLERIASYTVEGKDLPLCTINGQSASLAEFYDKVALDVSSAIDGSELRHSWMKERYGFRSRQGVEILDVVAEQTLRGEGPVAELRAKHPGAEVSVHFTARDGDHEQFVYIVEKDGEQMGRFAQGSDGQLTKYTAYYKPIFTATIGTEGEVNVQIPESIAAYRFPIQQSYGVGDFIDFPWRDESVSENHKEGEEFQTKSKLVQAEITGFTGDGTYTIAYKTPTGEEKTEEVSISKIRKANNPHWFRANNDFFSDVEINIETDEHLKSFLDGAQPIIDRYLSPGTRATMSAGELAKQQKACIKALMKYTTDRVHYPRSKDSNPDDAAKRYHELDEGWGRFPLGDLVEIERGVCRHQCILEHLLLQQAGIDSRLASGAANARDGKFRGFHIWCEVTLANGERFLSDQTWSDATIPLWAGAYSVDKRRVEMAFRTDRYSRNLAMD